MRGLEHGGASRYRLACLGLARGALGAEVLVWGAPLHPRAGPHPSVDGARGLFGTALLGDTVASTLPSLQPPAESGAGFWEAGLLGASARPARREEGLAPLCLLGSTIRRLSLLLK